jgi:hypothetical protein
MTNGMSPRIRHIVSSLAAVATTAMLLSAVVDPIGSQIDTVPGASDSGGAWAAAADRFGPGAFFSYLSRTGRSELAPRAGVEPTTYRLGGDRSIH